MLQAHPGSLGERPQRANLVGEKIPQFRRRNRHPAAAKAEQIRQSRVCADGHPVRPRQFHRPPHHVRIARVKAARHVRGGNPPDHLVIAAQDVPAVALSQVAIDVDRGQHQRCVSPPAYCSHAGRRRGAARRGLCYPERS
jgi:hypothetical protein